MKIFKLLCLGLGLIQSGMAMNLDPISQNNQNILNQRTHQKFTEDEDAALKKAVTEHGINNWPYIASLLPGRTPRQCRERYVNYLSPAVMKDKWTEDEDKLLIQKVQECGYKWCRQLLKFFQNRSSNDLKNRFFHLRKNILQSEILEFSEEQKKMICKQIQNKEKPEYQSFPQALQKIKDKTRNTEISWIFSTGPRWEYENHSQDVYPFDEDTQKLKSWVCSTFGRKTYDNRFKMTIFSGAPLSNFSGQNYTDNEIRQILQKLSYEELLILSERAHDCSQFKDNPDPNFQFLLQKYQELIQENQQNAQNPQLPEASNNARLTGASGTDGSLSETTSQEQQQNDNTGNLWIQNLTEGAEQTSDDGPFNSLPTSDENDDNDFFFSLF